MKAAKKSASRAWLLIALFTVVGVAIAWQSFTKRSQRASIPVVNLAQLEASARQSVEQRIAEVRANPKSPGAWGELGSILRAFDFPREARASFAEAERLDPRNPRWPYFQGLLLLSENPAAAVAALRRAVARCGNEPAMPRLRLARLLSEQGRWTEAEVELNALLSAKPDFAPATLLLAHRANAEQRTQDAIALALRCTEDPRTRKSTWALLALLYHRAGDATKAAEAARRAAISRSDEPVIDPFEVEAAARRKNPREIALQTHDLLATGRLDEAAQNIEQLVKEHSQFSETWLLLGRLEILRRQFAEAEKSLRRHLELEADSTQGLFQLGSALFNQSRYAEAADIFGKATDIKPDFGPAHFNRGFALARSGRREQAVPCFREAIRHNPEHVESYVLLGDLLRQLGERAEALKIVNDGLTLSPQEARLRHLHAQLSLQM